MVLPSPKEKEKEREGKGRRKEQAGRTSAEESSGAPQAWSFLRSAAHSVSPGFLM